MPRKANGSTSKVSNAKVQPGLEQSAIRLLEPLAVEIMWTYYRDHKSQLVDEVRDCRDTIIPALLRGMSVDEVFAPFVTNSSPSKSTGTRRGGRRN